MSPFSGSSLLATGSTSLRVNSRACSWIMRRSSVMYGILRAPEAHAVGALEVDGELIALVEALGMPGDDPESLVRIGDPSVEDDRLGSERIAGIDGLMEGELVDAEERSTALAQLLDRETEHRGEDQHRIDDDAGMAVRAGVGGVEIVRIEVQGQRREKGALRFRDGAAPMVLEDPPGLEILVAVALRHRPGAGPEILRHSFSHTPHPEEARSAVSKGGQHHDWLPPFETRPCEPLLRVRLN